MLPPVHPGSLQLSPSHHLVVSCALISSLPCEPGQIQVCPGRVGPGVQLRAGSEEALAITGVKGRPDGGGETVAHTSSHLDTSL
jgi:hypothetical protein